MSILTLFTSKSPTIGNFEFDAVLESTYNATATISGYVMETGAKVADHKVINPKEWIIVGAVSNNPVSTNLANSIAGGISSLAPDNKALAFGAGVSASFLSGSDEGRSRSALEVLTDLLESNEKLNIDSGNVQLNDMVIVGISTTESPETEGGMIFEAKLEEFASLDTLFTAKNTSPEKLSDIDPSKSSISQLIEKGEQSLKEATSDIVNKIKDIF